ncbi:type II toxin-antitoxin system HipA family toxin [Campylobacter sp. RM16188]|uniref:type II toxin-antitoxin system HipA family toxin n=1 Tax=Campylobacter sp. RM16188 TaxID=1705725 RepID=UPI0015573C81|nr:type II toxin-antitoxin system HipA family toxin [Campylobacter sp. RM16188]
MKNIRVLSNETPIGVLKISSQGRNETYFFEYCDSWISSGYEIDPNLPLIKQEFVSKELWSAFSDISPDRWGRLIQDRKAGSNLTTSEYMLGVSDYFRIGSLRLMVDNVFVSPTSDIPKLTRLNELSASIINIEKGDSVPEDLKNLIEPSGSLGGARPKASVIKDNCLYIAKFPSIRDEYRQISRCEKTMLDAAKIAKINVCESELFEVKNGTGLLVKRFDRDEGARIPFKSAMTMLGVKEGVSSEGKSYCDLAFLLDTKNKKELFRRMVFNGLFGNTDDHLRNHGILYDKDTKSWNLSPAFDITPETIAYSKQNHALNFIDYKNLPDINLFDSIKEFFEVSSSDFKEILSDMLNAREQFETIAKSNGVNSDNLKMLKNNYMHEDFEKAEKLISNTFSKKIFINNKCCLGIKS